jgi:hypothetical protein
MVMGKKKAQPEAAPILLNVLLEGKKRTARSQMARADEFTLYI